MTTIGLILVSITTFISIVFLICYKWTRKVFDSYWFFLAFGITSLIYFIAGRWSFDIKNIIDAGGIHNICSNVYNHEAINLQNPLNQKSSLLISKSMLLDMCPFLCLIMSIAFICDYKRVFVKIIAPWSIFGGAITLFGGILTDEIPNGLNLGEYIFVGSSTPNNRLYFIMHFYLFVFGIIALTVSKRFSLNSFLYTCIFASVYLIYVKIMVDTTGCNWNATGMVANDWYQGEYGTVGQIIHLGFPDIQLVGYAGVFLVITIFVILKGIFCFDLMKRVLIIDKWWFKMIPPLDIWMLNCCLWFNHLKIKFNLHCKNKFKVKHYNKKEIIEVTK